MSLVIISTHPIQYHAPIYRYLQQRIGCKVCVIYGSDFSISGYRDKEFQTHFAWDTDLLAGYESVFLRRVNQSSATVKQDHSYAELEKKIDAQNPSMILILGYMQPLYRKAWLYARKKKYLVAFRMEAYDEPYRTPYLKKLIRDVVLRGIYAWTDAFLYIGEASKQHYRRLGVPEKKLYFSPYTVDASVYSLDDSDREEIRRNKRNELGLHLDDRVVLFSGKLIQKKDPKIIVESIRKLSNEDRQKTVILYLGDGPLREHIVNAAHESPSVRVVMCGFYNQTQLSPFYLASDVLILPSLYQETWGLVVNEALLHGLPCIVSDRVGCHFDLIESGLTGEVFSAGSSEGLHQSLKKCLNYAHKLETRKACQFKARQYSIEKAAYGINQAYEACVKKKSRGGAC